MYEKETAVIKALAEGVNYFTGEKADRDSILNDADVIRTLFRVYDILKSISPEKIKKTEFMCPHDIEEKFEYEKALTLTGIRSKISLLYPGIKMFRNKRLTELLIQKGLLEKVVTEKGSLKTVATAKAKQFGISNEERTSIYGMTYQAIVYDPNGQKLVLSLLKEL